MALKVNVKGDIGEEKYLMKLYTSENSILSDEPIELGGKNKGFNPFELLASSLAGCTMATLRSYISLKGWSVPQISVDVELEVFPKEKRTTFNRYIDFNGASLTEKQILRILKIAEKCPVHRILTNEIEIFTEIKSDLLT